MPGYVIIGNGIAGVTAARTIRQRDDGAEITIVSDENNPFYSRPGIMYAVMDYFPARHLNLMDWSDYRKHRINFVFGRVESVDPQEKALHFNDGKKLSYGKLLIASGSQNEMGDWPGRVLKGVVKMGNLEDVRQISELIPGTRKAVVVGGGLIGIEFVEIFQRLGIKITYLIRESYFFEKALSAEQGRMVDGEIKRHSNAEIYYGEEIREILGEKGMVKEVVTTSDRRIPCDIVAVAIGVAPRIDFLKDSGIATRKGILTDEYLRTNMEDVFAAGDCAEIKLPERDRSFVDLLWYTAEPHGRRAALNMTGERHPYVPDMFYNSANFFDLYYLSVGAYRIPGDDLDERALANEYGIRRLIHRDGVLKGVISLGPDDLYGDIRCLVEDEADVDEIYAILERRKPLRVKTGI